MKRSPLFFLSCLFLFSLLQWFRNIFCPRELGKQFDEPQLICRIGLYKCFALDIAILHPLLASPVSEAPSSAQLHKHSSMPAGWILLHFLFLFAGNGDGFGFLKQRTSLQLLSSNHFNLLHHKTGFKNMMMRLGKVWKASSPGLQT